jgi:hypothetical protein
MDSVLPALASMATRPRSLRMDLSYAATDAEDPTGWRSSTEALMSSGSVVTNLSEVLIRLGVEVDTGSISAVATC